MFKNEKRPQEEIQNAKRKVTDNQEDILFKN